MRRRATAPTLLIALLSTALVACGGGQPSGTNGATPAAGGPLATRMPAELGGQPVPYVAATGEQVATLLQTADATLLAEAVDDHRKPMSALKASVGVLPTIVVGALSIDGNHWTPGSSLLARTVTALVGRTGRMRVTTETIAGKRLLEITDFEDESYAAFVFISGQRDSDIAYFARGDAALVEEFFSKIR